MGGIVAVHVVATVGLVKPEPVCLAVYGAVVHRVVGSGGGAEIVTLD